jgi:hypothetical protein
MLLLFQAGLIAGGMQALLVAAAGIGVLLAIRYGFLTPMLTTIGAESGALLASTTPLLTWIDLLTAVGVALTGNRFIDATAMLLRRASGCMCPTAPNGAAKTLLVQLWIASAGFAALALRSPPVALVELSTNLGWAAAASFAWPGVMSIGVAIFGANAQAAAKAL